MRQLLHNIGSLHTCDDADRVLRNAYLVIDGGVLAEIGVGRPQGEFDRVEDMRGRLVVPGLINLHHHFFQTLTRAIPAAQRGHLTDWLFRLYPVWAGMEPSDLAAATEASIAQLLLTGATTTVDHAYLLPDGGADFIAAEVDAAGQMGARLALIRGSLTGLEADLQTRLSRVLGANVGRIVDDPSSVLADMRRTIETYHDPAFGGMLTVGLGPTTTTYDDPAFMRHVADMARDAGVLLHIHCHPRPDERATCADMGTTPLAFLDDAGWLTERTLFAHSTRLSNDEMGLCARRGVAVAHCPRMILRLGARITPVHDMLGAGMRVGIGVDGGASNDSGSMLGELRIALLLHRVAGGAGEVSWHDWLSPAQLLRMATREAAGIIGRDDIGQLTVGRCADLAAFDMRSVAYSGAMADPLSALFLAGDDDRAAFVMVGGRVLVRERQLAEADEGLIADRVNSAAGRMLLKAAQVTGIDYHLDAE